MNAPNQNPLMVSLASAEDRNIDFEIEELYNKQDGGSHARLIGVPSQKNGLNEHKTH